jgi:NADPH:quinone reductase-like Zn-dependent oxidoreductase
MFNVLGIDVNMSTSRITRQFWIKSPGCGEIVNASLPSRGESQVLVRTLYSGVSRGTESLVFRGEVPASQYETMRAPFQDGNFPAPVKYGYASVGEIIEGPDPLPNHLVERPVFCLYPHQDLYYVPITAVTPIPADVPVTRAVLAANMETAVNAVWDARPKVGDHIVIIGAGVVGLLIAWLCRQLPGTSIAVVDINLDRESVARALGVPFVSKSLLKEKADLVIHASGQPEGLCAALEVAGDEATIVEVSWYGNRSVPLPLGEAFHSRRLTIRSSQVGRLHPEQAPRWNQSRRMSLALELLRDSKLDVLITGESDFEELPEILKNLSENPKSALCQLIRYPGA